MTAPQNPSFLDIEFCLEPGLDDNSYQGEPGQTKNGSRCSRCSFQDLHSITNENQVSLLRIFLSDSDLDGKSTDLGVGCGKTILSLHVETLLTSHMEGGDTHV